MDIFDLSRWKPITHSQYAEAIGSIGLTNKEPDTIKNDVSLQPDNRLRIVHYADLVDRDHNVVNEPYVILMWEEESAKAHAFIRTDYMLDRS